MNILISAIRQLRTPRDSRVHIYIEQKLIFMLISIITLKQEKRYEDII